MIQIFFIDKMNHNKIYDIFKNLIKMNGEAELKKSR
jgi:hypothetical protein